MTLLKAKDIEELKGLDSKDYSDYQWGLVLSVIGNQMTRENWRRHNAGISNGPMCILGHINNFFGYMTYPETNPNLVFGEITDEARKISGCMGFEDNQGFGYPSPGEMISWNDNSEFKSVKSKILETADKLMKDEVNE